MTPEWPRTTRSARAEGRARSQHLQLVGYIDPKGRDAFARKTGIKVVYDIYDNNEILETKLVSRQCGQDCLGVEQRGT